MTNFFRYLKKKFHPLVADKRDILANAVEDNERIQPVVQELSATLNTFLTGNLSPFSKSILEGTMRTLLKRIENASRMHCRKIEYKVSDHYRWFESEPSIKVQVGITMKYSYFLVLFADLVLSNRKKIFSLINEWISCSNLPKNTLISSLMLL